MKRKYSIDEINNGELNIVCRVYDEETFNILIQICPNMHFYYDETCNHYLLPRSGRGGEYSYGCEYTIIDPCDIDGFGESSVYVFGNGVPSVWDYDI